MWLVGVEGNKERAVCGEVERIWKETVGTHFKVETCEIHYVLYIIRSNLRNSPLCLAEAKIQTGYKWSDCGRAGCVWCKSGTCNEDMDTANCEGGKDTE